MLVWRWRARRFMRPLVEEIKEDEQRLHVTSDDWLSWWQDHGERELRCILMAAWDPVGVGDVPEAWDEYDDYAAGVAHRLREGADDENATQSVADYLTHIERDYMSGVSPPNTAATRNRYLGEVLVAWYEWSFKRRGRPPQEWIDED